VSVTAARREDGVKADGKDVDELPNRRARIQFRNLGKTSVRMDDQDGNSFDSLSERDVLPIRLFQGLGQQRQAIKNI
jgi:hypothetical protein